MDTPWILGVPAEMILEVAKRVGVILRIDNLADIALQLHDFNDVKALAATCKKIHETLAPTIFSNVRIDYKHIGDEGLWYFLQGSAIRCARYIHICEPTVQSLRAILDILPPATPQYLSWSHAVEDHQNDFELPVSDFLDLCRKQTDLRSLTIPPLNGRRTSLAVFRKFLADNAHLSSALTSLEVKLHWPSSEITAAIANLFVQVR